MNIEKSIFSQHGEDGVIEHCTNHAVELNKFFFEIGCGFGLENNTTNLLVKGWHGIVADLPKNIKLYEKLLKAMKYKGNIYKISGVIDSENIVKLYNEHIAKILTIDFFSLDIDSYDFFILQKLLQNNFRPKIICVEYNSFLGNKPITVKYTKYYQRYALDPKRGLCYGASLEAWKLLLQKYNYDFLTVDSSGVNAFFINPNEIKSEVHNISKIDFKHHVRFQQKYNKSGEKLTEEVINQFKDHLIYLDNF